jgi:acyl carrier protein
MRRVVAEARGRWGRIDAVIHAAAPSAEDASLDADSADFDAHLGPRAHGALVLDRVLGDDPPSIAIAISPLHAALGEPGSSASSAAAAFLDAFAHASPLPWTSVEWDDNVATTDEGMDAFHRILSLPRVPRIVVSPVDPTARTSRPASAEVEEDATPPAAVSTAHPRPAMRTAYAAPSTELEEAIAQVWEEMLGTARVGVDDDFFELGGHSLLGSRVVARLRGAFGVELPLDVIFRAPTIAGLAAAVEERLLAAVEAMSEDEALELA